MNSVRVKKASKAVKIAMPESELPVLISCREETRSGIWRAADSLEPVKKLENRDLKTYMDEGTRKDFERDYGAPKHGEKLNELDLLLRMARAVKRGDPESAQEILLSYDRQFVGDSEIFEPTMPVVDRLSWLFTCRISKSAPIVWKPDNINRLAFGLYCDDVATALFLLALQQVGVAVMGQCEGCGNVLIAERTSKRFCTDQCKSRTFMRKRAAAMKKERTS